MTLLLLLACFDPPSQSLPAPEPTAPTVLQPAPDPGDWGEQPPLPANNPMWAWDAQGFVPDAHWYGEKSWDDVRMRVLGHQAVAMRDQARIQAEQGELAAAAGTYGSLVALLQDHPPGTSVYAKGVHAALLAAAERDQALCAALAQDAPVPQAEGLAGLRARYLELARTGAEGEAVWALAKELEAWVEPPDEPLDIYAFGDFDDRHALRVTLFQTALDAADPLGLDEPWGYWEQPEQQRQARVLHMATVRLASGSWGDRGALVGDLPQAHDNPIHWPSQLAAALHTPDPGFTVPGLGRLPTGDTLIDTGAQPGPASTGTLARLGLDDPAHTVWLKAQSTTLNATLTHDPDAALAELRALAATLDAHDHDSRYYNVKAARNEGVRVFARAGRPDLAQALLSDALPLHNQDWMCPNRAGILQILRARLEHQAGDERALATLGGAHYLGSEFLGWVAQAEAGQEVGRRPPPMGPPPTP
jgi:hypothetical protein